MNAKYQAFILAALCNFFTLVHCARAQGTAFTYQGQLVSGGLPANGSYNLTFSLFNGSTTNSGQVGATITNAAVGVTNGIFTVTLDFGSGVFTGNPVWLAIAVGTNGVNGFTPLSPPSIADSHALLHLLGRRRFSFVRQLLIDGLDGLRSRAGHRYRPWHRSRFSRKES